MCNVLTSESWQRLRAMVQARAGETCQYCGKRAPDGEPDHVLPLSRGGTDALYNLVWACRECHRQKGDKTPREWVQELVGRGRGNPDNLSPGAMIISDRNLIPPNWVIERIGPDGAALPKSDDVVDSEGFIHLPDGVHWMNATSYAEGQSSGLEIITEITPEKIAHMRAMKSQPAPTHDDLLPKVGQMQSIDAPPGGDAIDL